MKLKPTILGLKNSQLQKQQKAEDFKKPKERKSNKDNTLPSDIYKPMFAPIRFLVKESFSEKHGANKTYMELSVKRFDDELGLPYIFIQMYQESSFYTGYLKNKSVHLPLDNIGDLFENLEDLSQICDTMKI